MHLRLQYVITITTGQFPSPCAILAQLFGSLIVLKRLKTSQLKPNKFSGFLLWIPFLHFFIVSLKINILGHKFTFVF